MNLFRNILTAIWCAVVIGLNVFGLIMFVRVYGLAGLQEPLYLLPVAHLGLLSGLGVLALVSTKFLWAICAVAALSILLGLAQDVLLPRGVRAPGFIGSLIILVPTYFLARWNTAAAQKSDFNPVKEF